MPAFVDVGIDAADASHQIYAASGGAAPLRFRITNDLAGFQRLLETLHEHYGDLPCRFALENPSSLLARFLRHAGHAVYAVNPRSVARMREALAASGKKDDPLDAEALCWLLRLRAADLAPVRLGSEEGPLLRGLVRQRVEVVEEKNRLLNQLTAVLKGFYPRALELFQNLEQPLTFAFLRTFSSPGALAAATEAQWAELFAGHRYPQPRRIPELLARAQQPQIPVSPVDEALGSRQVVRLVRSLEVLLEELHALEADIQERFERLPDAPTFRSLPGAAEVLAPALFALLGDDRDRWKEWGDLARLSGAAPVTRSSGRACAIGMRHHCDHHARRTLHLFAACSRRKCGWAAAFYAEQRRKGKTHGTALRNLALKWLRILFRIWKDGTTYDESRYLKGVAERAAPKTAPSFEGSSPARRTGGGRTPSVYSAGAGPAGSLASATG